MRGLTLPLIAGGVACLFSAGSSNATPTEIGVEIEDISLSPINILAHPPLLPHGFTRLLFADHFALYPPNSPPSPSKWTIDLGTSYPSGPANWGTNEIQTYTSSPRNIATTAHGTLLITPLKDPVSGNWTSARIETTPAHDFACAPGSLVRVQAAIKLGDDAPAKQLGIWPAFWMLGSALRGNYWGWPGVGEIDIMEAVNGVDRVWQTVHCGPSAYGGPCNEWSGVGSRADGAEMARGRWHVVSVDIDRRNTDLKREGGGGWEGEKLVWRVDGRVVFSVNGTRVGDEAAWTAVTRTDKFVLLNVAVGGSFPDYVANEGGVKTPTGETVGGRGSGMEVEYVAVFGT
ncbi:concanavalin A-like lectin/glucanase domain-containing protein [Bombardia bombarda]|uniref:Concanavalin A-like lectin/glucanase domain-containing protein n=1 Tax=Bombardia bombarda TaxID=252184 RepID=A0AA39WUQ3_9PEZI|nr:concanavalin A-like lectin/glucanase domain-containing protein [Bombardia bombarda]